MMNEAAIKYKKTKSEKDFNELFRLAEPFVTNFLMRSYRINYILAKDLASDTMLKVYYKIHLFDPEKATFSTWCGTIARNEYLNYIKVRKRVLIADYYEDEWIREPEYVEDDLFFKEFPIEQYIDILEEPHKSYIQRAYFTDEFQSDIAEDLGMPTSTFKTKLRKARRILKKTIDERNYD